MMHPTTTLVRRTVRVRRGTTVAELAFVLPVVMLLLLGTMDFAMAMYAYGTVSEAARGGARYAIVHGSLASSPVGPAANDGTVASQVKSYAPALDPSKLTITSTWNNGSNNATEPVTVSATYNCQLFVGKLIGVGSVNVTGSTRMLITH